MMMTDKGWEGRPSHCHSAQSNPVRWSSRAGQHITFSSRNSRDLPWCCVDCKITKCRAGREDGRAEKKESDRAPTTFDELIRSSQSCSSKLEICGSGLLPKAISRIFGSSMVLISTEICSEDVVNTRAFVLEKHSLYSFLPFPLRKASPRTGTLL